MGNGQIKFTNTAQLRSGNPRNILDLGPLDPANPIHADHILELQNVREQNVKKAILQNSKCVNVGKKTMESLKKFLYHPKNLQALSKTENIAKRNIIGDIVNGRLDKVGPKHVNEAMKQLEHFEKLKQLPEYQELTEKGKLILEKTAEFHKKIIYPDEVENVIGGVGFCDCCTNLDCSTKDGCFNFSRLVVIVIEILLTLARLLFFLFGSVLYFLMRMRKKGLKATSYNKEVIRFNIFLSIFICPVVLYGSGLVFVVLWLIVQSTMYFLLGWYYRGLICLVSGVLILLDILFVGFEIISLILSSVAAGVFTGGAGLPVTIMLDIAALGILISEITLLVNICIAPIAFAAESIYMLKRCNVVEEGELTGLREDKFCCCITKMSVCYGVNFITDLLECCWCCCSFLFPTPAKREEEYYKL